jgi:hypothetical protein
MPHDEARFATSNEHFDAGSYQSNGGTQQRVRPARSERALHQNQRAVVSLGAA